MPRSDTLITQKERSVQSYLLKPLLVAFILVNTIYAAVLYLQHHRLDIEFANETAKELKLSLDFHIDLYTQALLAVEKEIINDPILAKLLREQKREQIAQLYKDSFSNLSKEFSVTHYYFHLADLTNLVRLHAPSRYGDKINRVTANQAFATQEPYYGMELGVLGTFTLRVVHPIHHNKELIGFIELGMELEDIISQMRSENFSHWAILLNKALLSKKDWVHGTSVFGSESNWDFSETQVLHTSNFELTQEEWSKFQKQQRYEHEVVKPVRLDNTHHIVFTSHLEDVTGKHVGDLVIKSNVKALLSSSSQKTFVSILILTLFLITTLTYLYFSLKKVDSLLKTRSSKLLKFATRDTLTDLPNRKLLQDRLTHALSKRQALGGQLAIFFIDLDHFKQINDSFGHAHGDELLKHSARRLSNLVSSDNTIARLGGDEFVIVLERINETDQIFSLAKRIIESFRKPFMIEQREFHTTASVGICLFPNDGHTQSELFQNADAALYQAKEKGRDQFCFYEQQLTLKVQKQVQMEHRLRQALAEEKLFLVYQPIFDATDKHLVGIEALCRWQDEQLGYVPPNEFIALAEKTALIHELGDWVLKRSCKQGQLWLKQGLSFGRMSINASSYQLQSPEFADHVALTIQEYNFPPHMLEVEITESALMENINEVIDLLKALKGYRVSVAIDDFGTGYSSLSYLKRLPIQRVKIDRSFVDDLPDNKESVAITNAIISLAKSLDIKLVAEGVENEQQLNFLQKNRCDYVQGYLFSRPLPVDQMTELLYSLPSKRPSFIDVAPHKKQTSH